MFSYYGSKSGIIGRYPLPQHRTIIEPFAGAAPYALRWRRDRSVWINDKYHVVYEVWKWIQTATKDQIHALPELKIGEDIRDYNLPEVQQWLMGFAVGVGRAVPSFRCTGFGARQNETTKLKKRLFQHAGRLTDWTITNQSYADLPDVEATWFIDPPYQQEGFRYVEHDIDYGHLGEWCKSRRGQVIVCEGPGADWLPFRPFKTDFKGASGKPAPERIYHRLTNRKRARALDLNRKKIA